MTGRQLRDALSTLPDWLLDRPVGLAGDEYFCDAVNVDSGGLMFGFHVVLEEYPTHKGKWARCVFYAETHATDYRGEDPSRLNDVPKWDGS